MVFLNFAYLLKNTNIYKHKRYVIKVFVLLEMDINLFIDAGLEMEIE